MVHADVVAMIAAGFLREGPRCCEYGYCQAQIEEAVHLAARVTETVDELYPELGSGSEATATDQTRQCNLGGM